MRRAALFACIALVAGASSALADTVKLKNGDLLSGKVVGMSEGKLVLKTSFAGDVKIDLAQIETIATDDFITLELKDGTKLDGRAVEATGGSFVVEGGAFGKRDVSIEELTAVNKPPRQWNGSLLGSGTWSNGNTQSTAINVDAHAENRGETDRITLDAWYRVTRSKDLTTGNTSTNERKSGAKGQYDYFFKDTKVYAYGNLLAEKDAAAEIDLRFIIGAGAGYQFIETEKVKLAGEAGLAWIYEDYSDATDTSRDPALRLAGRFDYIFNEQVAFFEALDVYKSLNGKDWLVHNKAGLREKLTDSFFAQQWMEHTYDTSPAQGAERLDVTYYVGVGWTF